VYIFYAKYIVISPNNDDINICSQKIKISISWIQVAFCGADEVLTSDLTFVNKWDSSIF